MKTILILCLALVPLTAAASHIMGVGCNPRQAKADLIRQINEHAEACAESGGIPSHSVEPLPFCWPTEVGEKCPTEECTWSGRVYCR